MSIRTLRLLAVAALAIGALAAVSTASPAAATGPTFTKITTPGHNLIFRYDEKLAPQDNHFLVRGTASADIATVDIVCIVSADGSRQTTPLAIGVPVSNGGFHTQASLGDFNGFFINCRLRAIPSGFDPNLDPVSSFTGPILYVNGAVPATDGTTVYGLTGFAGQGDAIALTTSAGECGISAIFTVETPGMEIRGPDLTDRPCIFALPGTNVTASGNPSGSAIKVDGHNAYLPGSVHDFLNGEGNLGLPQPNLSVSVSRPNNKGDLVITESGPLMRCNPDATYPPAGCSSLVNTGVTFKRVTLFFRGGHQLRVRDTFTANHRKHTVSLQYQNRFPFTAPGGPGFQFPGRTTFQLPSPGQSVTHLGTKAGSMFVRTDNHALSDDPTVDTFAFGWSRGPQKVQFDGAQEGAYGLPYSLTVPAKRSAYLGFAYSERLQLAKVKPLAALGVADMMNTPTVSTPHNGAKINGHSVTVKGSIALGANGLPTLVTVNGHRARLTVNANRTAVSYAVTFTESFGKHKLTATATDSAGNKRSRSVTVTNVAPN